MAKTIVLAGAGGWLGAKIAAELVKAGARPRLMLGGGENHPKAAQLVPLTASGARMVDGDLADIASLQRATQNADIVISAVQGRPDVIIDGQVRLAEAAKANGATHIFPSNFSVRFDGVSPKQHLFLGWRAEADAAIAATGLAQINTLNGAFMEMLAQDFFGLIDSDGNAVRFWGEADQPYDFTHTDDVARFVATAAVEAPVLAGDFEIVGETVSPQQLANLASQATGQSIELAPWGDLEALNQDIATRQMAAPDDPMQWAGLQYHRVMANGAGKLRAPQNARFAGVAPMRVGDFLRTRLDERSPI